VKKLLDSAPPTSEHRNRMSVSTIGSNNASRFVSTDLAKELQVGSIEISKKGLKTFMGVDENHELPLTVDAIEAEFQAFLDDCKNLHEQRWWRTPKIAAEVYECMHYCKNEAAGSSSKCFPNSPYPRDCDQHGVRRDRTVEDHLQPHGRRGMMLDDFCDLPEASRANLSRAEVLALRIYTTSAYVVLNRPFTELSTDLTKSGRETCTAKHPFPSTIGCLDTALKKLRANNEEGREVTLWRGVSNVKVQDTFKEGGTMLGLTSTSHDPEVAIRYLNATEDGSQALLLKLTVRHGLSSGGAIRFLSTFPAEVEVLFPPLTYYLRSGQPDEVKLTRRRRVKIIEVQPVLP